MSSSPSSVGINQSARRATARRGVVLFLSLVALFNALSVAVVVHTGNTAWFLALMWSVAASSLICRLVLREGIRDVSFRFGGRRVLFFLAAALAYPLVIGLVAYVIAWTTGLADYHSPPRGFPLGLLLAATVTTLVACLSTTGEEIGWRGYLLIRLIDAGVPRPVLVSGIIWALWHAPLIITGSYVVNGGGNRLAGLIGFAATTIAAAFVLARLRLESGSIWPAVVLHAGWNSIIQSAFDPATSGSGARLWLGEGGLLVASVAVLSAVLTTRGRWLALRAPGTSLDSSAGDGEAGGDQFLGAGPWRRFTGRVQRAEPGVSEAREG
ncbi:type II CAAX prenyl endopeptidase Rce1 family protein [Cryptosporangium sp. NPDC051539]|uniref:CPBP family glutamic-type intramembrane protease n=1 Tax=Cryptosporangium sp. NPDC051539 TaxID=3363962 RepID=UPI003792BC99